MLSLARWAAAVAKDNNLTADQIRQAKKKAKDEKRVTNGKGKEKEMDRQTV